MQGRLRVGVQAAACALLFCAGNATAQIAPPHLVRTPDIHGDAIVFSTEGDLWLGSLSQGTATRITTDEGTEIRPRFSPDGTQIAFTAEYDGGTEIYVMPVEGGAPRRLTYDPAGATMVAWSPDGTKILFRSARSTPMVGPRLYLVPAVGGVPDPLPMERAAEAAFSADGHGLAYCRLPMEGAHWKRYRGGQANHVWIADLDKKSFHRIDEDTINEQYPVWAGDSVFYVSEKDGTANLWRYDTRTGRHTRITSHDTYDVKAPDSDGQQIVYQWGNDLWVYNIKTGRDTRVKLSLVSDRIHARPHPVHGQVGAFDLGPTGKRLVVEGRGQLFSVPTEKGDIRAIAPGAGKRDKQPTWSPDGKWIAYISDRSGEENLWIAPASGMGEPKQLTQMSKLHLNGPLWSPDSKRLAFHDSALSCWLIDIDTRQKTEVAHGEYSEIGDIHFSPDGKWLAYARQEDRFVNSLYLYQIATKQVTRLTFPPTRDSNPVFDRSGKYLYFLSARNVQAHGDAFDFQNNFEKPTRIYALALAADTPSPLPFESDEEPGATLDGKPAEPSTKPDQKKPEGTEHTLATVKIDLEGLPERLVELPIAAGNYGNLDALDGKILYVASDDGAHKLKQYELAGKKEMDLAEGVSDFAISADGKKLAVRSAGGFQVVDAGAAIPSGSGKVDISGWQIPVEPEQEWRQIFGEAWRNHRDTFYDPQVHGMDWELVRRKYEALLPSIGNRSELNEIIGDMQGEMNVSHEFVGGGYDRITPGERPGFGSLGVDLAYDSAAKAYRFRRILRGDGFDAGARSPLLTPGIRVAEGDYLFAINGTRLKADQDPSALLIGQSGKIVTLQVNSQPNIEGARIVRVKAMASDARARYYAWVGACRSYVQKNGGDNLGYIHIPNMGEDGIQEFTKYFYANLDKDGLILDVRYNGGGIVSGQILERLRRVVFEYDQSRYGHPVPYHYTAYQGRLVVLCNERTGSDGEYFCTGFRYMKLGPTVGTRTWGGFMAVGSIGTIDGGFVSTPEAGSFTPDGKWLPDGYGFNPDYVVDEDPNAFVAGRDPQMDKAITLLQDEIRRNPPPHVKRLAPPSREKAFPPNRP